MRAPALRGTLPAMNREEIDGVLAATLEDRRLSRAERGALKELLADIDPHPQQRAFYRHRAFELAKEALTGEENLKVVDWLEDVVKALNPPEQAAATSAEVLFSPGDECLDALVRELRRASSAVDICVFTITDNRLARAIADAHKRGVKIRILTDDEKSYDLGSDVHRLAESGIPVRYDNSPHHMHHKYAVFDEASVVTGSYNWTRSAAENNRENILISDDPRFVRPYHKMFERLWKESA